MRFQKRPSWTRREVAAIALIGLAALVLLGVLMAAHLALGRLVPGGGEFLSVWSGLHGFLFERFEPYSLRLAPRVQMGLSIGEKTYFLTLPFFLLLLYFPFALLPSAAARALWMLLSEMALVSMAMLSLKLSQWKPPRPLLLAIGLLYVFSFYSAAALLEGSLTPLLGFLYVMTLAALRAERYELAGALLTLSLFRWEVGLPFLLLVTWRVFSQKHWRVLAGSAMLLILLFLVSLMVYPGGRWFLPFLIAVFAARRAPFGTTSVGAWASLWPDHGERLAQAQAAALAILLIYEGALARQADFRRFLWTSCLALTITPLLGFRSELGDLSLSSPSLALIFAAAADRWKQGVWLVALLWFLMLALPWAVFLRRAALGASLSSDMLFLFYPLFNLIGLYWTRWWFLRPPRTWFEQARAIHA